MLGLITAFSWQAMNEASGRWDRPLHLDVRDLFTTFRVWVNHLYDFRENNRAASELLVRQQNSEMGK
jgi:hypothetical protein